MSGEVSVWPQLLELPVKHPDSSFEITVDADEDFATDSESGIGEYVGATRVPFCYPICSVR